MREDIEIPVARDVYIAAVKEWDEEFGSEQWNVYLISAREDVISTVLIMSRGRSDSQKTSTLRHNLGDVPPNSSVKIEFIPTEVLDFTNEYLVTFFAENKIFERTYLFAPQSISENKRTPIPIIETDGVLAEAL